MDKERQKRRERSKLPQKKLRRLELKNETLTQKGANEAAEGETYQSGLQKFINRKMVFFFQFKMFQIKLFAS